MKKVRAEEAIGKQLVHDMTAILANGFKGVRFKRGHIVTSEDIPVLLSMGKEYLYLTEEGDDFVHEEDAAHRVASLALGENIELNGPSEGKYALKAACDGLFLIDEEGLYGINSTSDYTFATLDNKIPVKAGQTLVGARIIPLFTDEENVKEAEEIAKAHAPVFTVLPYRKMSIGLVITGNEIYKGLIPDSFEGILREKMAKYSQEIASVTICPDDDEMIIEAIQQNLDQCADLILVTGGMSVDPDDLTKNIIHQTSDEIIFQGIPIQPGNMLTVGKNQGTYIVGVPGASMHSPLTSLDIFLPRIFAGLPFTKEESIRMGMGGLRICQHYPVL